MLEQKILYILPKNVNGEKRFSLNNETMQYIKVIVKQISKTVVYNLFDKE